MRLPLWELSNVILKLGFRSEFDGSVYGDTENTLFIEFAMYLLSFFGEMKKVCSSSSDCNAQFHLFNKYGEEPDIHIYQ